MKKGKTHKLPRFYFAYGANTNLRAMVHRCPTAKLVGAAKVKGHRLVFRGVADIVEDPEGTVLGALWILKPKDEKALDYFEGYPNHYVKKDVRVTLKKSGETITAMAYVMNAWAKSRYGPHAGYLYSIAEGYRALGLDIEYLADAVKDAEHGAKW